MGRGGGGEGGGVDGGGARGGGHWRRAVDRRGFFPVFGAYAEFEVDVAGGDATITGAGGRNGHGHGSRGGRGARSGFAGRISREELHCFGNDPSRPLEGIRFDDIRRSERSGGVR